MNFIEGIKYQEVRYMGQSDLVKLIKQDLKNQLPKDFKILARKELYAGGWSIHFTIKGVAFEKYEDGKHTLAYETLHKLVYGIIDQYNFHEHDWMSDYSRNNFYAHIRIEK